MRGIALRGRKPVVELPRYFLGRLWQQALGAEVGHKCFSRQPVAMGGHVLVIKAEIDLAVARRRRLHYRFIHADHGNARFRRQKHETPARAFPCPA